MTPWLSSEFDAHEQVCCFSDPQVGLKVIIAIHSTRLGAAVGGTRFREYPADTSALDDALRLSRAMSYKCALAEIPAGGGKAVILGDPSLLKQRELLHSYARFLNRIGAQFSTGEDVGFTVADCEAIREISPFVAGTESAGAGDPSVHTAQVVFHGIHAVLEAQFNRTNLQGVRVAVQGLGNVGWKLCERLNDAGARLWVTDVRANLVTLARERFNAQPVEPEKIHAAEVDIFAPCALGGVVSERTVDAIRARAIAGAANNQLESPQMDEVLRKRGILYAPDFVINAGGVIGGVEEFARIPGRHVEVREPLAVRLEKIRGRLSGIFRRASTENAGPEGIALQMARERLAH